LLSPGIDLSFALDRSEHQESVNHFTCVPKQLLPAGVDAHPVHQIGNFSFFRVASALPSDNDRQKIRL